jgi:hypothetical protein
MEIIKMITRRALIAKLQSMSPEAELLNGTARCYTNNGSRPVAASTVLQKLLDIPVIGQSDHCGKRGNVAANPKWLKQLFTEITWSVGTIHVGDVLQHLAA